MAKTSEATAISGRLMNTVLKEDQGFLAKGELCFPTCKEK